MTHGMPQFNMMYLQRLIMDNYAYNRSMLLFLSVLVMGTSTRRGYILALQPLLLTEGIGMLARASQSLSVLNTISLWIAGKAAAYGGNTSYAGRTEVQKWGLIIDKCTELGARSEVYQGLYLIFELVMPTRNFVLILLWWQYLQLRYVLDSPLPERGHIRASIHKIDATITNLTDSGYCPGILRSGYVAIRSYLASRSDPQKMAAEQQAAEASGGGAGAGGIMGSIKKAASGCSVV